MKPTMTGFGRASSTHTELRGWPNKLPRAAPPTDGSFRWGEEPLQKAQVMSERLRLNAFWEKSEERKCYFSSFSFWEIRQRRETSSHLQVHAGGAVRRGGAWGWTDTPCWPVPGGPQACRRRPSFSRDSSGCWRGTRDLRRSGDKRVAFRPWSCFCKGNHLDCHGPIRG